jgi:hypothetical protein
MAKKSEALPTQQFLDIQSIERNAVKLKSGNLRKVILVSGINFALKSEEEQGILTYAFQGFLNSLDFSIQIFIHSRKLNIADYLKKLEQRETQEENDLLKNQISEYREFINTIVSQNAIMQKRFFVVVPYDPIQVAKAGMDLAGKLFSWTKSKPGQTAEEKEAEGMDESLQQLDQRVDQVINGLNQMGLRAIVLNDDELVELFYNVYNPATTEKKVDLEINDQD